MIQDYRSDVLGNAAIRVESREAIASARKLLRSKYGVNSLLSVDSDPKTAKSNKSGKGVYTAILYLAPADIGGFNVCPSAVDCKVPCLHTSGNPVYFTAKEKARIGRKRCFFLDREVFFTVLFAEITAFIVKCEKLGLQPAIRLNGTSDIVWERVAPWIFATFPQVIFYDYTKIQKRVSTGWILPVNYSLTYSRQLANDATIGDVLASGNNVAVVFDTKRTKKLPTFWRGFPVVDGDLTDLRFMDPRGVIVGLRAKGKAIGDKSGFVVSGVES